MAAFPPRDRERFNAHWAKIRLDDTVVSRTVLAEGLVAGGIKSWQHDGQRLVGYWIGREHWGRGVATRALTLFLSELSARPLCAHADGRHRNRRRPPRTHCRTSPGKPPLQPARHPASLTQHIKVPQETARCLRHAGSASHQLTDDSGDSVSCNRTGQSHLLPGDLNTTAGTP
jgi:hypothetical protein